MKIQTKWFQTTLADAGKTQRDLAKVLGVHPAQVSLLLRGKRRMQFDDAVKIARFLNVPPEEVLQRVGVPVRVSNDREMDQPTAPIIGEVDEHGEVHIWKKPQSTAEAPIDLPEGAGALIVKGGLLAGATLFIRPNNTVEADAVGRMSVARLKRGILYLGTLQPGSRRGRWNIARGETIMEDAEVDAATPVLWIRP